ncbi:MAG: type II secretion system protein N, partial [Burkholderiales bacterium]|nr:type II secretion system protein N [Burkholderiales bacterium]
AAIGIPAYAAFMVLTAPATFIASRASRATDGRVHFDETQGTLWSGSLRAQGQAPGGVVLDRIAWRLVPAALAEGRIAFDVEVDSREARGNVRILRGWSEWEARSGAVRVDARALPAFFPLATAWRPEGSVSIVSDGVRWNEREIHGPFTLEWRDAAVALSDVKPLGTYRLVAQGAGENAKLVLSTIAGALRVSGQGDWKVTRPITFSGEARAEPGSAAALEPLLNIMGPKRPDGARSIEVRIR